MREKMGRHLIAPWLSFVTIPGRISISWPIRSTPCSDARRVSAGHSGGPR
jgi:hypothetical protein